MNDNLLPKNEGKQASASDVELLELSDSQLISKLAANLKVQEAILQIKLALLLRLFISIIA
jgi:hypothetical protein